VKAATAIGIVIACVGILGAAMMEGTSPAAFFNIPR
jgi:flagellar motor component MotA